jgi:hypothetical protein
VYIYFGAQVEAENSDPNCHELNAEKFHASPRVNWAFWGFGFWTVLNLLPLFCFLYIPSNDGPSHVYNAAMLHSFLFSSNVPVHAVFAWNSSLPPNLLTHLFLTVLMPLCSPVIAERLLVVSYAIFLPLGFRYFLRSISARTRGLEYLSLVWVYNSHLHWGFYNFLFSLVFFLFACGFWLRHRHSRTDAPIAILAFLATLLYFCHPVGLFQFWVVCFVIAAFEKLRAESRPAGLRLLFASSAISAVLYVHYVLTRLPMPNEPSSWPTVRYSASLLFTLSPLASYSVFQRTIAFAVLMILVTATAVAIRGRSLHIAVNGYLVAAVVTAVIVFVAPTTTGGGTMLTPRLIYFPVILICGWLASFDWGTDPRRWLAAAGILLAAGMVCSNWQFYDRYNTEMKEFMATERTWPPDPYLFFRAAGSPSTLRLDHNGTPFLSGAAAGYLAAGREQVLIGDYQALVNYFPLVYKKKSNPENFYLAATNYGRCSPADRFIDVPRYASSTPITLKTAIILVQNQATPPAQCIGAVPFARVKADSFSLLFYTFPISEHRVPAESAKKY